MTGILGKEGGMEGRAPRGGRLQYVSRLNVMIAGTAAIIGIISGHDLGSIASAILFLQPDLQLSTFMVSVVTATVVLGQLFGAFFAGRITNTIGRKRTMVLVALGYAVFAALQGDRKSTRLNSSHANISYAVFCLKKKQPKQCEGTLSVRTTSV